MIRNNPKATRSLAVLGFVMCVSLAPAGIAGAVESDPQWNPQASEKFVKLPASYLKRSLDNDFVKSELGQAMRDIDAEIALKVQTLDDLKNAVESSDGQIQRDLRQNLVVEKKAYVDLVSQKIKYRRRHLTQKMSVLKDVLKRMGREEASLSPARLELIARQDDARDRFETSFQAVDLRLLETSAAPETKYSREYSKNFAAIDALAQAIQEHPMAQDAEIDGLAVSKSEYIRQLVATTESGLALLTQEDQILGFMAKLVALDATALSEDFAEPVHADGDAEHVTDVTYAVQFFVD